MAIEQFADAVAEVGAGDPVSYATALFFAALTGVGMLAGVWAIRRFESWALRHTAELIAFAAGLLVSGALLHLLARSLELVGVGSSLGWTLAGFLVFYLVEAHFVPHVHARGEMPVEGRPDRHHHQDMGVIVLLGLAIHSVVDGVSVGAGLSAGAVLGSVTALLVIVHKMPVGIAAMSTLYHSGVPGRRAAWITTGLAGITPLAVVLSYSLFRTISADVLGILLALAAGSFLYIGAADLLPEGQATGRPANTAMFLLGTLVMVAIKLVAD